MPDLDILHQLVADVGSDTALRLMGMFKEDADKRLAAIGAYLQEGGDLGELRRHAHSLKGLCQTYGADVGGEAAMVLQDACDVGDSEEAIHAKAQAAIDAISRDIEAALQALRSIAANEA